MHLLESLLFYIIIYNYYVLVKYTAQQQHGLDCLLNCWKILIHMHACSGEKYSSLEDYNIIIYSCIRNVIYNTFQENVILYITDV